jgi:hypothetical protein
LEQISIRTDSWSISMQRKTMLMLMALCLSAPLAVSATQASAACITPPASAEAISQFRSNPAALVVPDSDTRTIEATTRDLAGTDASLAADLIRVAKGTTPRFQTAIAAGLAQAAIACSTVDQHAAQLIQEAVASFDDGQFQSAFAAVAGDLSTAATAAANAFATASVGSVVIVNPNGGGKTATTPGGGGTFASPQFTSAVTSPGGLTLVNPSTTPTTSAGANPVSATR